MPLPFLDLKYVEIIVTSFVYLDPLYEKTSQSLDDRSFIETDETVCGDNKITTKQEVHIQ